MVKCNRQRETKMHCSAVCEGPTARDWNESHGGTKKRIFHKHINLQSYVAVRFVYEIPGLWKGLQSGIKDKNKAKVEFPWMHQRNTGKSLSLPKGSAALLRATWIATVSQSDWPESRMYLIQAVADSSAVDSIKSVLYFPFRSRLCNTEVWNPIVALHLYYEWNYLLKNHSTVVLIFAGSLLSEGMWSTVSLERGGSSSEPADGCSGWFLTVSVSSFGFYLFEEKRSKCSLILAGGQPGTSRGGGRSGVVKVAAAVGWRLGKRTSGFFRSKLYERAFDLDLTLMSPLGTLQRCSPSGWLTTWAFEDKRRRQRKGCLERVWDIRDRRGDKQHSRKGCNIEKKRKTEAERKREEGWSHCSNPSSPFLHPREQRSHSTGSDKGERWATVEGLWETSTLREWQQNRHTDSREDGGTFLTEQPSTI